MRSGDRIRRVDRRRFLEFACVFLALGAAPPDSGEKEPIKSEDDGSFGIIGLTACREIRGYEDFEPLPAPALAPDEKLLVYFRPRHYKTASVEGRHEAHLAEDCRIRRRGSSAIVWSKPNIVEYRPRADQPPREIYIRNTISLKALKPGDYELEIVLHDKIGLGPSATHTLSFQVVAPGRSASPK
jgi:hypothetical protein